MAKSPFDDILNTNAILSDAECQRIHDLLAGPRKDLSDLMDEIGRIQAALDQLTRKRVELEGFIHAHEALLSPMRRLPDDTLRDIFLAALPCRRYATLSAADPPLLLCHISQRWRSLALSTPGLWTSLNITVQPIQDDDYSPAYRLKLKEIDDAVKDWISRSGSLPLSISCVIERGSGIFHMQQIVAVFIQHSRRWRSIRLDFPSHVLFAVFEALSPADVPLLRSAIISGFYSSLPGGFSSMPEKTRPYLSFLGAPTLERLSLAHGDCNDLPVRWDVLHHISLGPGMFGFCSQRALELLQQCPALETCSIYVHADTHGDVTVSQPCYLDHLQRLAVMDISLTTNFFQYLIIPNLRCLEYSYLGHASPPDLWPCFSVLPSTPCLESLNLKVATMTTDALVTGLRLVPTLKELRVFGEPPLLNTGSKFHEYDPRLVPLLTSPDPILCPHLQHITLLCFSALSDAALLAFLLTRTDPSLPVDARLTSARFRVTRSPDADIGLEPVLQQRITDGLQLLLKYGALSRRSQFIPEPYYSNSRTIRNQDESHDWDLVFSEWVSQTLSDGEVTVFF